MKNNTKLVAIILLVFLFCSCAVPHFKKEKVESYMLWYELDSKSDLCSLKSNALLRPITSNNALNTTYMLLFNEGHNLSHVPYSRWKVSIPQMIGELIYRDLTVSKIFRSVSKVPIYDCDIIISCHIFSFWIDLRSNPTLKVELLYEVLQNHEVDNRLLLRKTYETSKPLVTASSQEYATVGSEAISEINKQFFKELCEILKRDQHDTKE